MGGVLRIALVLLGVVVLLRLESALAPRERFEPGNPYVDGDLLVFSKGAGTEGVIMAPSSGEISCAIMAADVSLQPGRGREDVVFAASFGRDLVLRELGQFDVAHEPADAEGLAAFVRARETGTFLVLTTRGSVHARKRKTRRALDVLTSELGSRASPFLSDPCSWALIAIRDGEHWLPVAEGFSLQRGVVLAHAVRGDVEYYRSRPPEYVEFSGNVGEELELVLTEQLDRARAEGTEVAARKMGYPGAPRRVRTDTLEVRLVGGGRGRGDSAGTVRWARQRLAPGARFSAQVAALAAEPGSRLSLRVLVGGEVAGELLLDEPDELAAGPQGATWHAFEVELPVQDQAPRPFDLRVELLGGRGAATVYLGGPAIRSIVSAP